MLCVIVLILLVGPSMAQQCTKPCTFTYIERNDLQAVGCNETTMLTTVRRSKLSCALSCASNKTCAAFSYSKSLRTCSLCHSDMIQSLNFTSGQILSWPNQYQERWPLTDPTSLYTDRLLPDTGTITITIGTVIHFYGYLHASGEFSIMFMQDSQGVNTIFLFQSVNYVSTMSIFVFQRKTVILSYRKNGTWGICTELVIAPFPFVGNTLTTVDIFVLKEGYQIYIDQKYCGSYNHVMPYENIQYLRIGGDIEVYEIRV